MKYAVVIALVALGLWLWQRNRSADKRDTSSGPPDATAAAKSKTPGLSAIPIVACSTCGVHLPKSDALLGTRGVYCCTSHQRQADD